MSLTGALSSAISALNAQSQSLAMISDNISNADTTGYKTTSAMFNDLVTASSSATSYTSGGVNVSGRANITQQGLLAATTNATDVAIQGSGFFVTTNATTGGTTSYTRNGAFTTDNSGYLVNNGNYLEGWRTDAQGNIIGNASASSLAPINTQAVATSGSATTKTTFALNLPSDAAVTATPPTAAAPAFTSSMTVYDSLGTASSVEVTWAKTGTNTWTASFGQPKLASDPTKTTAAPITDTVSITFNPDGSLASTTPANPSISITGWTDGAADSSGTSAIALDFGTAGKTDGLTQYSSGQTTPAINLTRINSDGLPYGKLSSIAIGKGGVVDATYSNGQTIAIYKIAVATFSDPNGLTAASDGMYSATAASGNATLQTSGNNGAGTIYGSELESSTTDTSGQFSNMISAQQAYSAASQVITTVNKMFDTLISAVSR